MIVRDVALSTGPPLVGRDADLATLDGELERALAGEFRVVLVTGAAGLGKTRLASEALQRFSERAACLSARAYRWGGTASFGLWVEAIDRHLRRLGCPQARRLCRTALAALLPSVDAEVRVREPHRQELLEGLVDLLDRLSAQTALILALDDVHLADTSSWEALRYLGRRLSGAPIGVIATARPEALQRRAIASEVLLGLDEDGLQRRITLKPLSRAEVTRLAHDVLRGEPGRRSTFVLEPLVSWLMERSSGHPLYVIGLLRAFLKKGGDPAAPSLERVPENLQQRINLEIQALGPTARDVLEALAVVEQRIDVADLAAITGLALDVLGRAIETLGASRLVDERSDGAKLACEITHPVVSDAVYQQIGGTRRRALHRTVGRALLRASRLGSAAGHYARAAEPGNDEAVDALCEAMLQAESRGLYQEALAVLAALLDVLPADDSRWLRILHAMVWQSEWVMSHLAENDSGTAIVAMDRIERHVPRQDAPARAAVTFHLASFLSFGAGRMAEAERACRSAVSDFELAGDVEGALLARNELAWNRACGATLAEGAALADEVLDDALVGGHSRAAVHAAGTQAYVLSAMGAFDDSARRYDQAIELAGACGLSYRVAWAMSNRAPMLALAGRLGEAFASLEVAPAADRLAADAHLYENLACCHWLAGRLHDAAGAVERAAVRRPMRGSLRRAWAAALAARLHAEMGLWGRAASELELVQATYDDRQILVWSHWADWTAGFLAWSDGESWRGLEAFGRAAQQLEAIGAAPWEALVRIDEVQFAAESGDVSAAANAAKRLDAIAHVAGGALLQALARLGQAWSSFAAGRPGPAITAAAEAAEQLAAAGYRLYSGIALDLQGRAMARRQRTAALEPLSGAVEVFAGCGAVWRQDAALSRLGQLGSRGRRAAAVHGPGALSERERAVAVLAAAGHTARETGEQLFIGRRTVETHLANVYVKLGVSSKRELVRRAEEFALKAPIP